MSLQISFLIFLTLSFHSSCGIQLQPQNLTEMPPSANNNITNRQSFYHYQYQPHYQFQYQPVNPPNWQSWGNQGSNNVPSRPFVVQISGTSVQFPGPVNNKTYSSNNNQNYNLYPNDSRTNNKTNNNKGNSNTASINTNSGSTTPSRGKNNGGGIKIEEQCKCGIVQKVARNSLERITGGTVSKDNSWPWMAAIVYIGSEAPFWFCGASLINDRYLITAAHCQKTIKRRGLSNIRILMGSNGIPSVANAAELYEIDDLKIHPLYKPNVEEYDIGLLRLKNKMSFTDKISPICLTQRGTPFTDRMATVAGWGSIKYRDDPPDALREVELKVVTNANCQREYLKSYGMRISSAMLCAWLPGKDSCQGDSGGPLFLKTASNPQVYTQIGVVSFGPPQCGETTIPGVYTRISSTIRWIKANTKEGTYCSGAF